MAPSPDSLFQTVELADPASPGDGPSRGGFAAPPRRLSLFVGLFAAAVVVVAWLAVFGVLAQKRAEAIQAELRQNVNLASVLAEQTLRVIAAVDQSMLRVDRAVTADPGRTPELSTIARETGLTPGILVQLSLIDAQGRFVSSNLDPTGEKSHHVDLSTREHVRIHLAPASVDPDTPRPGANGLFVGKPVLGKVSHRWTIQMSRRLGPANAAPLGVVVASLDPAYFEDVYRRVKLGHGSTVALVGADLTVRARVMDGQPNGMGSRLGPGSALAARLDQVESTYVGPSSLDHSERIIAIRRVADYPLYVSVTTPVETALGQWRATRRAMLWMTLALTLLAAAAAASLVAALRRLERTHEALRVSEADAQAASHAKSAFLAAISHELRTPLTSIRGFAELMEHRLEQPRFRETAGLIRKGAEHLNQLLTEILDLTKIEAGAMELMAEPQDLHALVQGTADFFALSAADKGLALESEVSPEVPRWVRVDGLRLKQILNNLLSNAVKFTSQGCVRLAVKCVGEELHFEVEDTGPGIPHELQSVIFQRFRQGSARTSYEHGGTGLGLALSRSLAELMRGRLWVESEPGLGARFTLAVPLERVGAS